MSTAGVAITFLGATIAKSLKDKDDVLQTFVSPVLPSLWEWGAHSHKLHKNHQIATVSIRRREGQTEPASQINFSKWCCS